MRRLWIACAILAVVFAATLYNAYYLNQFTASLTQRLEKAEKYAETGDWEEADRLTKEVRGEWEEHTMYLHILLRHADTDDVNISFREVQEFINCREDGEYSAANARLMVQIELLYEAEQLSMKNVL